jgi:hypothetical protein
MPKLNSPSIGVILKALITSKRPFKIRDIPSFITQAQEFVQLGSNMDRIVSIMHERSATSRSATGHNFHQDLLVAHFIHEAKPQRHLDVGSRIDGFIAHVASFMPIVVLDFSPPPSTGHDNIQFVQLDLLSSSDPSWTGKYDSISCLNAIDQFGLGRYGDSSNPEGHLKGFQNLLSLLKPGGRLYISVPISTEHQVELNAHRKFHPLDIVSWPTGGQHIQLNRFDYVDDAGDIHKNVSLLKQTLKLEYGCGIYTFEKSRLPSTLISLKKDSNRLNTLDGPKITFLMDPDNAEGAGSFYQRPFLALLAAKKLRIPFINAINRHSDIHYQGRDFQSIHQDWGCVFGFLGTPIAFTQPCPSLVLNQQAIAEQTYHLPFDVAYEFLNSAETTEREALLEPIRKSFKANLEVNAPHLIPIDQIGTVIALHLRDRSAGDPIPTRRLLDWQMFSVDYGLPDNNHDYYSKLYANAVNSIVAEHSITKPILQIHSTGKEDSFKQLLSLLNTKIEVQFFLNEHAPRSFVAMIYADILIASHSSFSWLPMLLHQGPKYIRKNFRHFLPANTKIIEEVLMKDKNQFEQALIFLNMKLKYWLYKRFNLTRYQD